MTINFIDALKKTPTRVFSVQKILLEARFKDIFEKDTNNPQKVFCKFCKKQYKPRACDLDDHLKSERHKLAKLENEQISFSEFSFGKYVARSEIIWAFLTVARNLSFNFSEYANPFLSKMFPDSKIAHQVILNRKKTKAIIENVLVKTIEYNIVENMRKIFSISIDGSRDISNKKELMIAVHYFDLDKKKFFMSFMRWSSKTNLKPKTSSKLLKVFFKLTISNSSL